MPHFQRRLRRVRRREAFKRQAANSGVYAEEPINVAANSPYGIGSDIGSPTKTNWVKRGHIGAHKHTRVLQKDGRDSHPNYNNRPQAKGDDVWQNVMMQPPSTRMVVFV